MLVEPLPLRVTATGLPVGEGTVWSGPALASGTMATTPMMTLSEANRPPALPTVKVTTLVPIGRVTVGVAPVAISTWLADHE